MMFVAASQVAVICIPPFVVSAVIAIARAEALLIAVTVEATIEVEAALAFLITSPSILKAAEIVPSDPFRRATTIPENEKTLLFWSII